MISDRIFLNDFLTDSTDSTDFVVAHSHSLISEMFNAVIFFIQCYFLIVLVSVMFC